jgi:hypothetical protein
LSVIIGGRRRRKRGREGKRGGEIGREDEKKRCFTYLT